MQDVSPSSLLYIIYDIHNLKVERFNLVVGLGFSSLNLQTFPNASHASVSKASKLQDQL